MVNQINSDPGDDMNQGSSCGSHAFSISMKDPGVSDTKIKPWKQVDKGNDSSGDLINDPKERKQIINRWKD